MITLVAMNVIIRVKAMMVQKLPGIDVTTVSPSRVKFGTGYPNQSNFEIVLFSPAPPEQRLCLSVLVI